MDGNAMDGDAKTASNGVAQLPERLDRLAEDVIAEMGIRAPRKVVSTGAVKGDNYLGTIWRVCGAGKAEDGQEATFDLIVKSAPTDENFRNFAPINEYYSKEATVYNSVLPELRRFQEEKRAQVAFDNYTECYRSVLDEGQEALILKNMKALGYRMADRRKPLPLDHVRLVLCSLARLHAVSLALKDQRPQAFARIADKCLDRSVEKSPINAPETWEAIFNGFFKNTIDLFDPKSDPNEALVVERLQICTKTISEDCMDMMKGTSAGEYAVITHGDTWCNNLLFLYEDQKSVNTPTNICFIDWQICRYSSPVLDISYFLYISTDHDLRDKHFDNLINEYYHTLAQTVSELGSDPNKVFPRTIFDQHLHKYMKFGLVMAASLLKLICSESDEAKDFSDILDVNKDIVEGMNFTIRNEEGYKQRMRDVILHLVKMKYI